MARTEWTRRPSYHLLTLQAVSTRKGLTACSGQGGAPRSVCPAAVLTGFAWNRREAKCRTAVSSSPLQPLKQNCDSITGKKTLGDLTGSACLSLRKRNYYIYSSLAGRASQEIPLIHPSAEGCSGQYCLSQIPALSFAFCLPRSPSQILKTSQIQVHHSPNVQSPENAFSPNY